MNIDKRDRETLALFKTVYGKYSIKRSNVFERQNWFKEAQMTRKKRWLNVSSELLNNSHIFARFLTRDGMWCFRYNSETKRQNMKTENKEFSSAGSKSTHGLCFSFSVVSYGALC